MQAGHDACVGTRLAVATSVATSRSDDATSAATSLPAGLAASPAQYGWKLTGRSVTLLGERTIHVDLAPVRHGIPCYQCGICTASCALAEPAGAFPRRTVALLQLGLMQRAYRRAEPWECHGCGDCTERCPNRLGPARQLADLRQQAVREASRPRWLTDALDGWRGLGIAVVAAALAVTALAATSGSLIVDGPVHYASFLPHPALVSSFGALLTASLLLLTLAAARAWRWYRPGTTSPRELWRAMVRVSWEALLHRRHAACPEGNARSQAHAAIFVSFLGLSALAAWAAGTVAFDGEYPFPLHHPAKVLGNVLALLLLAGSGWVLVERLRGAASDRPSRVFDTFLPLALFSIALTGVALEICRVLDLRGCAYPLYVGHLAVVALLLGLLPWTKLAHAVHRLVALASQDVAARDRTRDRQPRSATSRATTPKRAGNVPAPQAQLAQFGFARPAVEKKP